MWEVRINRFCQNGIGLFSITEFSNDLSQKPFCSVLLLCLACFNYASDFLLSCA